MREGKRNLLSDGKRIKNVGEMKEKDATEENKKAKQYKGEECIKEEWGKKRTFVLKKSKIILDGTRKI